MAIKGPRARQRLHDWVDERGRALDAAVAEKLRANPGLISRALENLDRWERQRGPEPAYVEWRQILRNSSSGEVISLLLDDSERADRLRQSSPFAGILSQDERLSIFRRYEAL
jgi:hypothetical protein